MKFGKGVYDSILENEIENQSVVYMKGIYEG